ncbi:hypothetical protein [Microbacterium terricola]|uniref:Serine/threonine protein kinase n=1 Tax=Microbacterium terricola TaxID=344163 RepID=A0ABM8DVQ7_9MICO|nr:hypothetical protein [Microbacterium terricola]UYK39563.1 hypothetical protein OAU46_12775 [Microbacterium terricola]BDV29702.1 hypothetical protein Microterr_03620 [Microbacterium terricola]
MTRDQGDPDDETVRVRRGAPPPADETVRVRRPAPPADAARRRAAPPVDEEDDDDLEKTALRRSGPAAPPDEDFELTALREGIRIAPPAAATTAPAQRAGVGVPGTTDSLDETELRRTGEPPPRSQSPVTTITPQPTGRGTTDASAPATDGAVTPTRPGHVPDAEALRAPLPPRTAEPVIASRAPVRPEPSVSAGRADHESVERAGRARSRRRAVSIGVAVAVVALIAATALVLLLTLT